VTAGQLRQPRGAVKINGAEVTGWVSFDTDANEFASPDTFKVVFAISGLPAAYNAAWWASQTADIMVELFAGFPADPGHFSAAELTSIFYGRADDLDFDYDDLTLHVTGRDLTAALVDNKSSEKYRNQTSSQIAASLAGKHGLATAITATTTKAGVYFAAEHVDLRSDRTEWDLITWLARQEGFRVFVKGKVLHFEPIPKTAPTPFILEKTSSGAGPDAWSGQTVKVSRTLTVAKDISVSVTSWNSSQKLAYTRKASRKKKGSGSVQAYTYRIANLTPEKAQARANQILAEISKHEVRLAFGGPADSILAIDGVIQVKGTGTVLDQTFYPASIARTMTFDGGYGWTVEAKNHSPETQATP
jgi:phage protein D